MAKLLETKREKVQAYVFLFLYENKKCQCLSLYIVWTLQCLISAISSKYENQHWLAGRCKQTATSFYLPITQYFSQDRIVMLCHNGTGSSDVPVNEI